MVGEYERAFYRSQYAAMAPLFEHYSVHLWLPEVGGRVDYVRSWLRPGSAFVATTSWWASAQSSQVRSGSLPLDVSFGAQ